MDKKLHILIFFAFVFLLFSDVNSERLKHESLLHFGNLKTQPSNGAPQSIVIQTINILMDNKKIPNNNQYTKCFSAEQQASLDNRVQQALDIGRTLTQNTIEKYPKLIKEYLHNSFTQQQLQCFFNSNDLKMLMLKYRVQSFQQAIRAFQHYSYQHFSDAHQIFTTLGQLLKNKDLQQVINFTDKTFNKMFTQFLNNPDLDEWGIQVINPQISPDTYYGITISNGLIGAVSDKMPFKISKTVLAGAYDKYGRGRVDNIVETMNVMDLELSINGIGYPKNDNINFRQYIDFKNAQFTGKYSVSDQASVFYKYMALKNSPGTFFLETEVTAHQDININVKNAHQVPDYLNDVEKEYENVPNKQIYRVISTKATTKTNKIDIVLSSTFYVDDNSKKYMSGDNMGHQDWDSNRHLHTLTNIKVPKGQIFKFYLVSSLISSEHHKDPKNQAIRLLLKVASTKSQQIVGKHYELWGNLWQNDIIIQGNSFDQRTIRSMVYHFYSFINEFKSYGLSPMGLSGLGYNGHIFWDMDLWMFPGILILNPKLAKSLIEYRYDRLEAAKNNAFLNGFKGAMFPWESSKTGDQECPIWAATGPLQHHITGTVALAAWKYYCVTKDLQWLKEKGRPIIEGAAQFWQSRVQKDQNGTYHINNVVAADQWAENIDDDAFTNAIAIQSLRIANKLRQILDIDTNPDWDLMRKNIIIHRFNDTNVTKQYASYNGENIKQADVNLLAFPLKQVVQKNAILRDLQFYENKVPVQGTPAMTQAIFALLYSRLGNAKKSYDLFKYSFTNNMLKPFGVMAQTQFGTNPYFLTGAGGVIQSVIFGYAGVDITDQGVVKVQTVIPDQWDRVLIKSPVLQITNNLKQQKLIQMK